MNAPDRPAAASPLPTPDPAALDATRLEEPLAFDCGGETLVGILGRPPQPLAVGVVIIVGGPQYRIGSHRQFTLLARSLAAAGHAVLRFDYRGMGDSSGEARSFEQVDDDIAAAIDTLLARVPEVRQVVLWGLCDAASAALLYLDRRADHAAGRVAGLCLLNPWVRSAATHAATQVKHYYTARLRDPAFWRKLLRGEVGLGNLRELAATVRRMLGGRAAGAGAAAAQQLPFQARMARALGRSGQPVLLVLSGQDLTAREFIEVSQGDRQWQGTLQRPGVRRVDFPEADHTFSNARARAWVESATLQWLGGLAAAERPEPAGAKPV